MKQKRYWVNYSEVKDSRPLSVNRIEDGMKEPDKNKDIKTQDIAELVANNMA